MSGWATSDRRSRLPADWRRRRAAVLAHARRWCQALDSLGGRCNEHATDCDHVEHGDDHSLDNLHALCRWHHARKSSAEGASARRPKAAPTWAPEPHPGLV
ncbi:hypothetical protein NS184_12130 [Curtobacterium luteum]|uniref:HNH endonuclease n=1 Tax=Curtobacterium luteum TaxID=33881 RepID=A0A175RN10_9MICO|nr:hypothetical protein NS184_12130 [Curtobacterium luteum]